MKRLATLVTALLVWSLALAAPASAAVPANDTYTSRVVIGSFPFNGSFDTSEATTDALDLEANASCGAPAVDASVWYEFTPDADGQILIDASHSDYAVGIIALIGSPGAFNLQTCGPGAVGLPASSGVPLTILVFDYDGVGNGGNLELTISAAPPPPVLDLTVNATGSINAQTGLATVRGTIACSGGDPTSHTSIGVNLVQVVGRFRIWAYGGTDFECDGTTHAWAVELTGENGKLAGGRATVSVYAQACSLDCAERIVDRVITLKR